MSRLNNSDFQNVVDLITAIYSLGPLGCGAGCGAECSEIIEALRRVAPDNTMTDDEVCTTLVRGVRSGVFLRNNVSADCPTNPTDEDGFCTDVVDNIPEIISLFSVNQAMAVVNAANQVYTTYFNGSAKALQCGINGICDSSGQYEGGGQLNFAAFLFSGNGANN